MARCVVTDYLVSKIPGKRENLFSIFARHAYPVVERPRGQPERSVGLTLAAITLIPWQSPQGKVVDRSTHWFREDQEPAVRSPLAAATIFGKCMNKGSIHIRRHQGEAK